MQKRLDRSKRAAERKKAEEQKVIEASKAKNHKQLEFFEQEKPENEGIAIQPCKLFDWVEIANGQYKGIIGVVEKINPKDQKVLLAAVKKRNGHKVTGKSWFNFDEVEPLPLSRDEDDLLAMIDLALDRKDKQWFMDLTSRLP